MAVRLHPGISAKERDHAAVVVSENGCQRAGPAPVDGEGVRGAAEHGFGRPSGKAPVPAMSALMQDDGPLVFTAVRL
jgi:hypothetical protein